MNADEAIDVILALARDPASGDDELQGRVRGVLLRLAPEQRAAVSERTAQILA